MVRLLVQVLFNSEKSSSYQSGITGQLRGYKFHLFDTERLRPFAGFFVDIIYEDTGRAEYTSTPDYLCGFSRLTKLAEAIPHISMALCSTETAIGSSSLYALNTS